MPNTELFCSQNREVCMHSIYIYICTEREIERGMCVEYDVG